MQFYLQASVVEKGTRAAQYRLARWDVILGGVFGQRGHDDGQREYDSKEHIFDR